MRQTLKTYFIPHEQNNYHPHVLHTKRAVLYGCVGIAVKIMAVFSIALLPLSAFMAPDVLSVQVQKIIALTNDVRAQHGLSSYGVAQPLTRSSQNKAHDMADAEYFSHTNPAGRTITSWIEDAGYDYAVAGENLAMGFHTAEDVVAAWKQSSTHYANLIDAEFRDIGVGVASGMYGGAPTIYVAQHFGALRPAATAREEKKNAIAVRREKSRVDWSGGKDGTVLSATAAIDGPVKKAEIQVRDRIIALAPVGQAQYAGTANLAETPEELFTAVVPPALTITDEEGETVRDTVDWSRIEPAPPSAIEKYRFAKSTGSAVSNVFSASRWIYLGLIGLFAVALLLNIVIEFRKQHPHVIAQTLGLIALFALLLRM